LTEKNLFDQPCFARVERPSRYAGNEINITKKPPALVELRFGLAFPDVYEVGMSHQGIKILYHILNGIEWLAAERVFCPWVDMEAALRAGGLPLGTLESGTPLRKLDILGFSLQHELCCTNVLTMLDLGGIPFRAEDRDEGYPLVLAGGPACFNPEPTAALFDAVLIGDGEEAAPEICRTVRRAKKEKIPKRNLLRELSRIQGVYIPSFFSPEYHDDGTVKAVASLVPGVDKVRKALVPDLELAPFPSGQVVPYSDPVHDRLSVEICRGCTRGCRFCQAGMIYRPVRERTLGTVLSHAAEGLRKTGYDEVSLLSLSSGDYSCIGPLLTALMDRLSGEKVAVSLPSLRIDSLDEAWFEQIKRVRKTGFTLAPEAGSDRLRRVINKTLTNRDILDASEKLYKAGWNLIKLYFMIGLPGETEEDLMELIRLSRAVAGKAGGRGKKPVLHVSVAAFVPKPHTPFMWLPQITLEESLRRIHLIRDRLDDRRIRVKWNNPEMSRLEGIFSRGDRRLFEVLAAAWKLGARFDAWGEHFRPDHWAAALEEARLSPDFYLYRTRSRDEIMPWEHIQTGVTREYLWRELLRSREEKTTPDCRAGCLECGVCDHVRVDPILHPEVTSSGTRPGSTGHPPGGDRSYLLTFTKIDESRFLGHLEVIRLFSRALRRAGLSAVHSAGFHPMPKIAFTTALPVGTESLQETVSVTLHGPVRADLLRDRINEMLPRGIRIVHVEETTGRKTKKRPVESHYRIMLPGIHVDEDALQEFMESASRPVRKNTSKGAKTVDARALVKTLRAQDPETLEMVIRHPQGASLKPAEITREVLHLGDLEVSQLRILKLKQVMG